MKALAYRAWLWLLMLAGNAYLALVNGRWLETRIERAERLERERGEAAGDIVNGVDLERTGIIIEGIVSNAMGGEAADISTVVLNTATKTEKGIARRIGRECARMAKHGCRPDQIARHARRRVIQCARAIAGA